MKILDKYGEGETHTPTHMNTQRVFSALVSAALALAATSTASAVTYNLNTLGTVAIDTVDGRAYFTTDFTKTEGTGVIRPFLSIQGNGTESGFNISQGVLDTKRNGQYTVTQRVSDLQTVNVDGVSYYSFLLDINEPNNSNSTISIESIKIYTSSKLYTSLESLSSKGTLQFDLDGLTPTTLVYNDRNSGSGQGDIAFFIPVSAVAGVPSDHYFYMYQEFGGGSAQTGSGYEETTHGANLTFVPVPEPNAIMPILAVLGVVVAGPFVRRAFHP